MDIHVRRMAMQRCRCEDTSVTQVLNQWGVEWRGLGQECPSYGNRSRRSKHDMCENAVALAESFL